jgi:hypothetical protein
MYKTKQVKKIEERFEIYLEDYKKENDINSLKKALKMIEDGDIKFSGVDKISVGYLPYNKGTGTCKYCLMPTLKGEPVFIQNKKGWHIRCSSDKDKTNKMYLQDIEINSFYSDKSEEQQEQDFIKGLNE